MPQTAKRLRHTVAQQWAARPVPRYLVFVKEVRDKVHVTNFMPYLSVLSKMKAHSEKSLNVTSDVKMTDENDFLSNSMMIKAKNIMKERIWINRVINETTSETHCEATGHFPPVRQYIKVDDCREHRCGPHGTCVDGVNSHSCYCDPGFQETKTIGYLKEDQYEFLEERRQKDLVSGLTWSRGIWCGSHVKRVIAVREEPNLHIVFYQSDVPDEMRTTWKLPR